MDEKTLLIQIPPELEDIKLPSPELIQYYKNYNDRRIFIDYDIDESLIEASKQIMEYNTQDKDIPVEQRKKIFVYVYSYGGDLSAAYSFIAICETSRTPVITTNMGVAMSAGLLILLAGHERYCLKRSQALIHSGSGGMQGSYEQLEESQKAYKKMVEDMGVYIREKTNIDTKLFNKNKTKDWYLSDKEQIELGVVNKIVENLDEIL
jgi:ATP-dependent Clp protease, protease subunit